MMIDQIASKFRGSLYLLLGLSAVAIGFAEGNFYPHFLTLPLIAVAYFYLDRKPILQMESFFTSVLGVLALVVAIIEFQQGRINVEMRILSASHLLAYFTWVVLLIEKQSQQYWWLIALSVLNMAVAASLTSASSFGLAVVGYLFLAAWTLSLFTAFRGTASLRASQASTPPQSTGTSDTPNPSQQDLSATARPQPATSAAAVAASQVRGGFHFDPRDNWLGVRLLSSVLYLSFASLAVGMTIFSMTPRIWIGNWQMPSSSEEALQGINFGNSVSGFTPTIRLGDMGEILENPTPVMYVEFADAATSKSLTEQQVLQRYGRSNLLFRGTSLGQYAQGGWTEEDQLRGEEVPNRDAPRQDDAIRIHYELEPVGRSMLFVLNPLDFGIMLNEDEMFRKLSQDAMSLQVVIANLREFSAFDTITYETISIPDPQTESISYSVLPVTNPIWTEPLQKISQKLEREYQQAEQYDGWSGTDFSEFPLSRRGRAYAEEYDNYFRSLLNYDTVRLQRLRELSTELCATEQQTPLTPEQRCLNIFNYLKNSGEFTYTLNQTIIDAEVDPVEDFVFNRKSGHCEYFASAMTLMLRTVGVPARIVSGFSGGIWDENRQQLVVQQRHAHAWVEAFVDGRWLVFDPTAPGGEIDESSALASRYSWEAFTGYLNNFWQTNVIGVSLARQNNDIYRPIRRAFMSAQQWGSDFIAALQDQNSEKNGGRKRTVQEYIFYLTLFLFMAIILTVVFMYVYFRTTLYLLLARLFSARGKQGQQQMLVFFRRFLEIAARNGLRKQPAQTAREFAHQFQLQFRTQLAGQPVQTLPLALTDAYYQARFRGDQLSSEDLEYWKTQLDSLGTALTPPR